MARSESHRGGQHIPDVDYEALRKIRLLRISKRHELTSDLEFMAKYKYNMYEVYNPGKRFLPSLLEWLLQFETKEEKEAALILLRKLIFISRREILELSGVTYQKILNELMEQVISTFKLGPFGYPTAWKKLRDFIRKKCVFVAMSDGAQIDYFRRHSDGKIYNDQVFPYYKIGQDETRRFSKKAWYAFLIDDMCGSGTTFANQLENFCKIWKSCRFKTIYFCPYIVPEKTLQLLKRKVSRRRATMRGAKFRIIEGMRIPHSYNILNVENSLFDGRDLLRVRRLCRKYYDPEVESSHTRKGENCMYGFGRTGILLVRYNNTPNNTPSIVWDPGPKKKALFKRLARHRD